MTTSIEKRFVTVLDAKTDTRKQREALVLGGAILEAVSWWQIAKGLHSTKIAIAGGDPEYSVAKTTKEGEIVYQPDGKTQVIVTQTFKAYCEETFTEAGLSRSRREELITAYAMIIELQQYGFGIEDLPKTVQAATLLAKWSIEEREVKWQEFLDTVDLNVLKVPKEIKEVEEGAESESSIEDAEEVSDKPLDYFMAEFIKRLDEGRAIEDEAVCAAYAESIIQKIESLTYEVKEQE